MLSFRPLEISRICQQSYSLLFSSFSTFCSIFIITIIINGIYIALRSQVTMQLGNGAANALNFILSRLLQIKEMQNCYR